MSQSKILATKISPSLLIGEKVKISTRGLKPKKTPPKKSEDCETKFWEYVAEDNTDVTLLKDYTDGNFCEDLISNSMLSTQILEQNITLENIVLIKAEDTLKGTKFLIYSEEKRLKNSEKVINKTATHKAAEYQANNLTLCYLEREDSNIFRSNLIDKYRAARLTQVPDENGHIEIN